MPTPRFVTEIRALIGKHPLWLSVATAVVLDDQGQVLLQHRADTRVWALPGGIIDPAEEPADAAVRECFEETGVVVEPEVLTSVSVSPPVTYANGDQVQYLELAFRCRPVGGTARVNDEESIAVGWYPLGALPELDKGGRSLRLLNHALQNTGPVAFHFSGLTEVLGQPYL